MTIYSVSTAACVYLSLTLVTLAGLKVDREQQTYGMVYTLDVLLLLMPQLFLALVLSATLKKTLCCIFF